MSPLIVTRIRHRAHARQAGQKAVELVGEALAIGQVERRRAAGLNAAAAQCVHEIAQRQVLADVFGGVELAPRIERVPAALDMEIELGIFLRAKGYGVWQA